MLGVYWIFFYLSSRLEDEADRVPGKKLVRPPSLSTDVSRLKPPPLIGDDDGRGFWRQGHEHSLLLLHRSRATHEPILSQHEHLKKTSYLFAPSV